MKMRFVHNFVSSYYFPWFQTKLPQINSELKLRTVDFVGAEQFHIFTLQPLSRELEINRAVILQQSPQQQQQILRQQEMDGNLSISFINYFCLVWLNCLKSQFLRFNF